MRFQIIVAMNVTDSERYASYRAAMLPVLDRFGGRFVYDLVVSHVLKSPVEHPITRVFSIAFPSREARVAFFADPAYALARAEHFDAAVSGFTIVAETEGAT